MCEIGVLQRRIRVAQGQEPGDLLLTEAAIVNVFIRQVERGNIVIADGYIAGVGPHEWEAREVVAAQDNPVLPGLVDSHMHLESTLLWPPELARAVVPQGTSTIIADPHEIANVLGVRGIHQMLDASQDLPLDIFFMAPSCVPATQMEDAGATLDAAAVEDLLSHPRVLGLAEVMDFPAVLSGQASILSKVLAAQRRGSQVDGHAPGLSGRQLVGYIAAGVRADHESTEVQEALDKAALGMMVQVRQGSSEHNLETLLPLLVEDRLGDWAFATDDILPTDIAARGHINALLRLAVRAGVPAPRAVRHATLIPSRHYALRDCGAVAPGYRANLVMMSDLEEFDAELVIHGGRIVARDGQYCLPVAPQAIAAENTVRIGPVTEADLQLETTGRACLVIRVIPGQIVTERVVRDVPCVDGHWVFLPGEDLALATCIERHAASGKIGLGLIEGFGLQSDGAFGTSVAHDSHNLIVLGTNPRDMLTCVRHLEASGGGFVVATEGRVLADLPLPVAGLMSTEDATAVRGQLERLHRAAEQLGCGLASPFAALSFLALPVIPELRVTPRGLFDVGKQQFVDMSAIAVR